jgi:aspartyl-tRNA(Asn)/glutamyl-tRNA(Gln) amidotransferase subunit A
MTQDLTRRGFLVGAAAGTVVSAVRSGAQATDPTRLTIAEAARLIAARKLSPVELTRAYLARIETLGPKLNAFVTVTADAALAQAGVLEREVAAGRSRGPLHGIPLALKDNIDTAGVRTTAACALFADRVPREDAVVVTRLRDAGAIFLGKLNMHEVAFGGTSVVSHAGAVHNPWHLDYSAGGSSGGSAAAVAARLCAAALGTDTAASIRMPAAFCGVVGLKATHGLASIRGILPLSESLDHVGPLAKSVADSAIVMTALAGFDPLDPTSRAAETSDYTKAIGRAVSTLRIGLPRAPFFADLNGEIEAAAHSAIALLGKMTRSTTDVSLPGIDTGAVLLAESHAVHAAYLADPERRALYKPVTLQRLLSGASIPAPAYIDARRRMTVARNTAAELFTHVDVLVTPTTMATPVTVAAALADPPDEMRLVRNTILFNALGLPSISVQCGFTRSGLPIGLQITGPPFAEARVLALAHAYEQATAWHHREPRVGSSTSGAN